MKGIFLGKFQPPHLGHVRTIVSLAKQYDQIVVGVTQDSEFIDSTEVKAIFDEVLEGYDNIEVVIVEGVVEKGTAKLPEGIDLVLSGNQNVLSRLEALGYQTTFVPRTKGVGYSSSEIRSLHLTHATSHTIEKPSFKLVPINKLKPLEKVFASHMNNLKAMIESSGVVKQPLIVDRVSRVVLDGSHRFAYLKSIGCELAPVLWVDYSDESIFVGNRLRHRFSKDDEHTLSKSQIVQRALHEELFEPRTTRHFFPFRKEEHPVSLAELKPTKQIDIEFLIADSDPSYEIDHNVQFIEEIDEEISYLQEYIEEERGTKAYLTQQIEMMRSKL
jgi:cytidyltransferase-like protein